MDGSGCPDCDSRTVGASNRRRACRGRAGQRGPARSQFTRQDALDVLFGPAAVDHFARLHQARRNLIF
jgi:hypothetical protein